MKKLTSLFLLLALVACGPAVITTPTVTPSPSSTPAPPTATSTSAPTPTSTPIAVIEKCVEILPAFPEGVVPTGILVLSSPDGLSLLNFNQQTQRNITKSITSVGTSPDGKWFSYSYLAENDEQLVVESADGKIQTQIPFVQSWMTFGYNYWLDNKRLWFPVFPNIMEGEIAPVVIVDPFTGKQQELVSDYPGIKRYFFVGVSPDPGLHFGYSSVVYHPTLDLVIYPQVAEDGAYIVLLDRQSEKMLVRIPDSGLYGHMPIWLPDGNQFVVVAKHDRNSPREWLMVNRDGEIRQLTHFGDLYSQFEIGMNARVSPDGHYLAFGLFHGLDPNPNSPMQLIILNLQTLEMINTCITFRRYDPVWSLDSQYLAVLSIANKPSSIIVLNPEQGWAVNISSEKIIPGGWLDSGE